MNRRHLIRSVSLATLGTLLAASGQASACLIPPGNHGRALRPGQSLHYDRGLTVTFLGVASDDRCPINAICVSQGDAVVVLRVKAGNQRAKIVRLHTDGEPNELVIPARKFPPGMAGIPKSYIISIESLNPLPTAGVPTRQRDYRLKLAISVAV